MKKSEKTSDKTTRRIRWIARIWSIPIFAFALVMIIGYAVNWITTGVADPYAVENYPFIENLPPIFMLLAIIGLGIAWFKEKLGGIINLFFCLVTIPSNIVPYITTIIIAFPGILFLVYWQRSKKREIISSLTLQQ